MGYTLLIVVATFLYGINVNMVGHYLKGLNPIHIATVSLAFMTIPAGIILWQQGFFHLDFKEISVQESVWASVGLGIGVVQLPPLYSISSFKRPGYYLPH